MTWYTNEWSNYDPTIPYWVFLIEEEEEYPDDEEYFNDKE